MTPGTLCVRALGSSFEHTKVSLLPAVIRGKVALCAPPNPKWGLPPKCMCVSLWVLIWAASIPHQALRPQNCFPSSLSFHAETPYLCHIPLPTCRQFLQIAASDISFPSLPEQSPRFWGESPLRLNIVSSLQSLQHPSFFNFFWLVLYDHHSQATILASLLLETNH